MSRPWLMLGIALGSGVLAAACGGTPKPGPRSTTTPTAVPMANLVEQAVRASLAGVPERSYHVSSEVVASHPNWVRFTTTARPEAAGSFQGGYGFAQRRGATWVVVASGSALVGCPLPGQPSGSVPESVLRAAGQTCPKR